MPSIVDDGVITVAAVNGATTTAAEVPASDAAAPVTVVAEAPLKKQPARSLAGHASSMDDGNLPLSIAYKNLSWEVDVTNNDPATKKAQPTITKKVINNISGTFRAGRLTAVMGSSGAGKTTLLNVIAGYAYGGRTTGEILVNGDAIGTTFMRELSAFVHQADVILETMTVREAVTMAAHLRLPRSLTADEKKSRVDEVMRWLSLVKVGDNQIGSPEKKGISGGERRRVSVAMELVRNPGILFLDEPTSGLDSFTAYAVAHLLQTVAHVHNRTIVATIHQPSSEIFHLFDDLCLLNAGAVIYHGPAKEAMQYFDENLNYKIPRYTNPSDYIFMSILNGAGSKDIIGTTKMLAESPHSGASVDEEQPVTAEGVALAKIADTLHDEAKSPESVAVPSRTSALSPTSAEARLSEEEREKRIMEMWNVPNAKGELPTHRSKLEDDIVAQSAPARLPNRTDMAAESATLQTQLYFLCLRALNDVLRNPYKLRARLGQCIFQALFCGLVYLQVGDGQSSIQNRKGVLFFICASGMMNSTMGTLTIFVPEKAVFKREYASKMYGLPAFFFSKFFMEMPLRICMPLLLTLIMYWMVDLQSEAGVFWIFAGTVILLDFCGTGLGVLFASAFSSMQVALAATPMVMLPLMLFSGFFLNSDSIPPYFDWLSYLSPIKYAFRSLAINEFTGLKFSCDATKETCTYSTGEQVLSQLNFNHGLGIKESEGITVVLAVGCFMLAYIALWRSSRTL